MVWGAFNIPSSISYQSMPPSSSSSRRIYLRYSPLSIPLPLVALTALVGVGSGYYIFDGIVRSGVDRALADAKAAGKAAEKPARPPNSPPSSNCD